MVLAKGAYAVSEVAKGFRQRRFFDLSDRDKRDMLKLMARVAEQAYRRGIQQGAGLAGKSSFRGDLWEWRYTISGVANRSELVLEASDTLAISVLSFSISSFVFGLDAKYWNTAINMAASAAASGIYAVIQFEVSAIAMAFQNLHSRRLYLNGGRMSTVRDTGVLAVSQTTVFETVHYGADLAPIIPITQDSWTREVKQ